MKKMYEHIFNICIGIINGLIFTLVLIIILNSSLLALQFESQVDKVLENLDLFSGFLKNTPEGNYFAINIRKAFEENPIEKPTSEEIDNYNKEYYKFIIPIGIVLLLFGIGSIIYIIFINKKYNTTQGSKIVYIDWIFEVIVTLSLIGFLYLFIILITNKYILSNIGRIFKK